MTELRDLVDRVAAESGFSGVVRIDDPSGAVTEAAHGYGNRGWRAENTPNTRFAIASGVKGLTALTVMSLVEDQTLTLDTPARALLGDDLPFISDKVTVVHLLSHTSGIGDYVDEDSDDPAAVELNVPAQSLVSTEAYLPALDGFPAKFPPGERFSYCNSGFVVLALIAQRAAGVPFEDLVQQRVCAPAGMTATEFLRADELPEDTATGYLSDDGFRTNVFHLPLVGSGDGGIYTTTADMKSFWDALFDGRIVSGSALAEMTRPRSDVPELPLQYGLGFWLHRSRNVVILIGSDFGVSFRSARDVDTGLTYTVIANTENGAWPVMRALETHLGLRD